MQKELETTFEIREHLLFMYHKSTSNYEYSLDIFMLI